MRRIGLLLLAAVFLHACATKPKPGTAPRPAPTAPATQPEKPKPETPKPPSPPPAREPGPTVSALDVLGPAGLPGWGREDHVRALMAWQAGCGANRSVAAQTLCNRARLIKNANETEARQFFEDNFTVEPLPGTGILTAYFAPVYEARSKKDGDFDTPVRPAPADLKPGQTYAARADIEKRPSRDALAWMRAEDLFFLQVQGSGTLVFPGGARKRAAFAAHNSRPFAGIANPMRDKGLLEANNTSGDAIRQWLADHRGPAADEIMRINPRYVFFKLGEDDGTDPVGAAGVPLPAGAAIAVDPAFHDYGELIFLDGQTPLLAGAFPVYQRLVMALDTGGAIRGEVRADLYLGRGEAAGREAGRVRHDLKMYRLIPRAD